MDSSPPGVQRQPPLFCTGFTKRPTDTQLSPKSSPPIRSSTQKLCLQHTAKLLGALGSWGYRVSQSKAQIAQTNVTYLGLSISHQQRTIPPDRIQALINCPLPKTKRELLSILSLLNFFRIWIPNFSLLAKPLYEATKGCPDEPLFNPSSLANPLCQLTQSLLRVPTLHLPDHTRPFFLFAHSNQGQALRLLCQRAGDTWAPIAYLSKQLDMVTKGWPPYIQAMAAIAALVPKANKLSRHTPLTVCSPHTFRDLLSHWAFLSLPPSRVQVLHAFLLHPRLSFSPCSPLNLASLLPTLPTTDPLLHSCSHPLNI